MNKTTITEAVFFLKTPEFFIRDLLIDTAELLSGLWKTRAVTLPIFDYPVR